MLLLNVHLHLIGYAIEDDPSSDNLELYVLYSTLKLKKRSHTLYSIQHRHSGKPEH